MSSTAKPRVGVQDALLYSQITFAMNAARMIKTLLIGRQINRTEREIITFAETALIINAAKLWDKPKNTVSLESFIKKNAVVGSERKRLLDELNDLRKKHESVIKQVLKWRHKLIAHLDKSINSQLTFKEFDTTDIAGIQEMLLDVSKFVQKMSWYPKDGGRGMSFLDYHQIRTDLRIES